MLPWLFPVPIRKSRFVAADRASARFNIEVAHDRIASFSFVSGRKENVLLYDLQTQLHGNYHGRHGSGRSGIYLGRYLKGIGRTPAAANWNDHGEIYHGSGHLSVGSAIRERLITAFLQARDLGDTIVPCEAVLLGPLAPAERRAVRQRQSSSRVDFAPADAHMIALTVKPADFARISNFVFALNHFNNTPQHLGELFVELEEYLHPPGKRSNLDGSPNGISRALDAAFQRGLENFRAFSRIGLSWFFLNSNFSLDGRFLDLETPLFFGAPFVGLAVTKSKGITSQILIGFEEFGFVLHWRLFIAWLKARVSLMMAPEIVGAREARPFLRELRSEISARFSNRHFLYRDNELIQQATANLANPLNLGNRDRAGVSKLARYGFDWRVYAAQSPIPDMNWRPLAFQPAQPTPFRCSFKAPGFIAPALPRDGEAFAAALDQLGSLRDSTDLLRLLAKPACFVPAKAWN